ncbi:HNH endonuclease [Paeniglutamicibacter terrestris]|uniref:HNH endonuclease n=1 Tax=Paeniglutamicibacter terrestris TaxID=2723403 RepID=A0ABX1G1F9_9MICC|nr:HNH endonuclease [Paeniglutamicibacter terrestris]NKG19879.1 HNH endonuclease [Paeniglutamicibacter terrestris]
MAGRLWTVERDRRLREEAIEWLKFRTDDGAIPLTRAEIRDFSFEGEPFALQATQQGIRKPRQLEAALSIQTVYRTPGQSRPYEDTVGSDGLIRYMWRGDDPNLPENRALKSAMENDLPLIWFIGVGMDPALFQAVCPVYLIDEEPELKRFVIVPHDEEAFFPREAGASTVIQETVKRFLTRETKIRLHQPVFRSTVLRAYEDRCAVCNLAHRVLLDAAHIVPDSHELGIASVVNGMALCKIHHAAFDSSILGIRPDMVVQIRPDLLEEIDGPMLEYGLKERHGQKLMMLPTKKIERPRADLLEIAYERFLHAKPA